MRESKAIKFNGKSYPVSYNRYALGEFMRDQGLSLSDMDKLPEDLKTMQKLAYYGLVGGHAAKTGEDLPMTYIEFCIDLADDSDALNECIELFAQQQSEGAKEAEAEKKPKRQAKATATQAKH